MIDTILFCVALAAALHALFWLTALLVLAFVVRHGWRWMAEIEEPLPKEGSRYRSTTHKGEHCIRR